MPLSKLKKVLGAGKRNRAPKKKAYIKGAIANYGGRQELKYVDIAAADYVADTTGTVTALNLIAVGDDNTSRDGREVCIKSVQLRGLARQFDTSTVNWSKARILLVWDNAVNSGTIATVAQILSAATSESFPLVDNARRFTILYDKSFSFGPINDGAGVSYAAPCVANVEVYKKINSLTQYSGTTAAIGSIQNGGLLMVTIGDQAAGTCGVFRLATRVRFTDQ